MLMEKWPRAKNKILVNKSAKKAHYLLDGSGALRKEALIYAFPIIFDITCGIMLQIPLVELNFNVTSGI